MAAKIHGDPPKLSFAPPKHPGLPILAMCLLACGSDLPTPNAIDPAVEADYVILLSLDTFRADASGWLGDPANSFTPSLDSLARDSVTFTKARAQIPFTQPSHMSMFTGLYPVVHGVHGETAKLHSGVPTLPQILRAHGFSTHGFFVNYWMKGDFGFDRGFDRYDLVEGGVTHADHLNEAAFSLLDGIVADRERLFLFIQYFDPHSDDREQTRSSLPYYSPQAFRSDLEISDADASFCDDQGHCATQFIQWADLGKRELSPQKIARIRALYDAGIRYLDTELGKFFDKLRKLGIYDRALIIVTSDHGEEFREHGNFLHNDTWEENIAIPLLIKFPNSAFSGKVVDVLAESVDLLPTVLDQLNLDIPPNIQGKSLLPSILDGTPPRRYSFSQDKSRRRRFALTDVRYKLIYDTKRGKGSLYDLNSDPGEQLDIASTDRERFEEMKRELELRLLDYRARASQFRIIPSEGDSPVLGEEERERLRGIGYILD
jgi:arylsulfatase A-like enzyme